jgi:hypothetical protein
MYIISYSCSLENIEVQQIHVKVPEEASAFFDTAEFIRHSYHTIKYNGQNLDIVCPHYRLEDGRGITALPWYLIPGRPYPLQVYLFAIDYYCATPDIGQRGAAEATRIKFDLKTFSHSTLNRSFRLLEKAQKMSLEKRYGKEFKINDIEEITAANSAPQSNAGKNVSVDAARGRHSMRRFPSVADTSERRDVMSRFLPKFQKDAKTIDIEAAVCRLVKNWHGKYRRLLL